jgi:hypothetical protein
LSAFLYSVSTYVTRDFGSIRRPSWKTPLFVTFYMFKKIVLKVTRIVNIFFSEHIMKRQERESKRFVTFITTTNNNNTMWLGLATLTTGAFSPQAKQTQ